MSLIKLAFCKGIQVSCWNSLSSAKHVKSGKLVLKLVLKLLGVTRRRAGKQKERGIYTSVCLSVCGGVYVYSRSQDAEHTHLSCSKCLSFLSRGIFFLSVTDQIMNKFCVKSFIHALGDLLMVHQMVNNCSHVRFRCLSREDIRKK